MGQLLSFPGTDDPQSETLLIACQDSVAAFSLGLLIDGLLATHLMSQIFFLPFSDADSKACKWQDGFSSPGLLIPSL